MILTPAESRALAAIMEYIRAYGYPPSLRDLNDVLGFARSSVQRPYELLCQLEEKGYIQFGGKGLARSLRVMMDVMGRKVKLDYVLTVP